eukprot:scaffold27129_cov73-Attheya_sp.AAC.5
MQCQTEYLVLGNIVPKIFEVSPSCGVRGSCGKADKCSWLCNHYPIFIFSSQSMCRCHCGWRLRTFLVPLLLWLASRDFSCTVITMAGNSGFSCRHYGWQLGTFLVPSSLWLVSQDFSCAFISMACISGLLLCHRRPCSIRAASRAFGWGDHPSSDVVLSSLDSFGVMLYHRMLVNLPATLAKACAIVALVQREWCIGTFFCHYQLCSK